MIKSNKIVLMYHDIFISDSSESGFQNGSAYQYKVSKHNFEKQVEIITNLSCKDNVEFTFDDGGVSFYTVIAPILERYGYKGIFFISTKFINTNGFLTEYQIKELHDRGHVIGSHSHSHPTDMSSLNENQIIHEWESSRSILSKIIGCEVTVASIPNGYASKTIYDVASKTGYKRLYTSEPTDKISLLKDLNILGRYVILNTTSIENIINTVSTKSTRLILYYKWLGLSFAKMILGSSYDKFKKTILKYHR